MSDDSGLELQEITTEEDEDEFESSEEDDDDFESSEDPTSFVVHGAADAPRLVPNKLRPLMVIDDSWTDFSVLKKSLRETNRSIVGYSPQIGAEPVVRVGKYVRLNFSDYLLAVANELQSQFARGDFPIRPKLTMLSVVDFSHTVKRKLSVIKQNESIKAGTFFQDRQALANRPFTQRIRESLHPAQILRKILPEKTVKTVVLDSVSFYLRMGHMCLILGEDSCGKRELLQQLATNPASLRLDGQTPSAGMHKFNVTYSDNLDRHHARLTVRETLQFAYNLHSSFAAARLESDFVDIWLALLGLTHRAETIVGDDLLRGISGGEKRRVSVGTEIVAGRRFLLLDEPTTGLDSSAALDLFKAIRVACHFQFIGAITAVKQPSYELFSLFNTLLLLHEGRVAYFGPSDSALQYFASLGFTCPRYANPADFLQSVLVHPEKYYTTTPKKKKKKRKNKSFPSDYFTKIWQKKRNPKLLKYISRREKAIQKSESSSKNKKDADDQNSTAAADGDDDAFKLFADKETFKYPKYRRSRLTQFRLCLERKNKLLYRDKVSMISKLIKGLFLAFVLGSLFWQLDHDASGLSLRRSVLFYGLNYTFFNTFETIATVLATSDLFHIQKNKRFFAPLPYLIAETIAELPLIALDIVLFSVLIYYSVGLNATGIRWILYEVILLSAGIAMTTMARAVALVFNIMSFFLIPALLVIMILYNGFLIPPSEMVPWFGWLYYLDFSGYAYRALMMNEYMGESYGCTADELVPPVESLPAGAEQVCQFTSGDAYLESLEMSSPFDWSFGFGMTFLIAGIWVWTVVFFLISWVSLRFHLLPISIPTKPPVPDAEEEVKPTATADDDGDEADKDVLWKSDHIGGRKKRGATLEWQDLSYTVFVGAPSRMVEMLPKFLGKRLKRSGSFVPLQSLPLLEGVSGYTKPGMCVALMGSSGAGKSTLLDVLARRKTGGRIDGTILFNRAPIKGAGFAREIGYVEQANIHNAHHTVREAFRFSAQLRLPRAMSRKRKNQFADALLPLLQLSTVADVWIQDLTSEQLKRVTIGVELAADPTVLFLDEPTSGLDSRAAAVVVQVIKRIADSGKAVVCTIHQPSQAVFAAFSHLLLLKKGGKQLYFGKIHNDQQKRRFGRLKMYFAKQGHICPPHRNVADWMLEVIGAGVAGGSTVNNATDFAQVFKRSRERQKLDAKLDCSVAKAASGKKKKWRYSVYPLKQTLLLFQRQLLTQMRLSTVAKINTFKSLMLGLFLGFSFYDLGDSIADTQLKVSLIFLIFTLAGLQAFAVVPQLFMDRAVFYRERASRYYSTYAYLIPFLTSSLPFDAVESLAFLIPVYWLSGLARGAGEFFFFLGMFALVYVCLRSMMTLISALSPTMQMASSVNSVVQNLGSLFSGFLISRSDIPWYWIWVHYINTSTYGFENTLTNQLAGEDVTCSGDELLTLAVENGTDVTLCPITSADFFLDTAGYTEDNVYRNVAILFALMTMFVVGTTSTLKCLNHQRR